MNINHLYYFQTVCKYSNVTRAAEKLHISQPSVTFAIKELERELGIELFHKVGNRIYLTPEGKLFLEKTASFIKIFEDFHTEALDLNPARKVRLTLGIPTILSVLLLPKILPGFTRQYPDIELKIFETQTLTATKMIDEASLDFAFGINDSEIYPNVDSEIIHRTNLVLFANVDNPLAREPVVTNEMLNGAPFVILCENSFHYKIITQRLKDTQPNIILNSNQLSTIRYMLENDLAVTILYKEIFENTKNFHAIPLEQPIVANISVLWRRHRYISSAMKAFLDYMIEIISGNKLVSLAIALMLELLNNPTGVISQIG